MRVASMEAFARTRRLQCNSTQPNLRIAGRQDHIPLNVLHSMNIIVVAPVERASKDAIVTNGIKRNRQLMGHASTSVVLRNVYRAQPAHINLIRLILGEKINRCHQTKT